MLSFVRSSASRLQRAGSHLALAIAMTGAVVVAASTVEAPAYAKEKAPKQNYSKGFVAAYKPVNDAFTKKEPDLAAVKAGLPAVTAAIETEDDRYAAGNLVYNFGRESQDPPLQREGVAMMLQSGKVPAENLGQYNMIAGQLSYNLKDYEATRTYLQAAVEAGYSVEDASGLIAESYFAEDKNEEGLAYLAKTIEGVRAAGGQVKPEWLNRGFVIAYNAGLGTQAADFSALLVDVEPNEANWGNAVAVLRIYGNYDDQGVLDLMRLSKRTDSLRNERDYVDYIEAADARRLPAEVNSVIEDGVSAGLLKANDVFVSEAKGIAGARLAEDKAELAGLARDASAASATASTAMAAGDAYLSWDDAAKAEEMYAIALTKAGVDAPRVLTRLGIAQADQGKSAEAQQTLAKVDGPRKAIARLWSTYAKQKSGGTAVAAQ